MSEFESRLTSALRDGAEGAPDVVGLADRARATRARRRRGRVGIAGLVLVVGAIGAVVPLVGGGFGGDRVAGAPEGWTTVSHGGLDVDVPEGWRAGGYECAATDPGWVMVAPNGLDGCSPAEPHLLLRDPVGPPREDRGDLREGSAGMWRGFLEVADVVVDLSVGTRDDARRILGSVRPSGVNSPDLTEPWVIEVTDGITYVTPPVPITVVVSPRGPGMNSAYASELELGASGAGRRLEDGRRIDVTAPTEALAQLVAGSARLLEADGWQTVEVDGVRLEVPGDWTAPPRCREVPAGAPAVGAAGADCREVPGAFVYQEALYDPVYRPGVQRCRGEDGWCGSAILGTLAVFVRADTEAVVRRIVDSAEEP